MANQKCVCGKCSKAARLQRAVDIKNEIMKAIVGINAMHLGQALAGLDEARKIAEEMVDAET